VHERGDFQHRLPKRLVDENQAIITETPAVKNMLKNRASSQAISDAGWHSLTSKTAYKAERAGKHFESKTCSDCGEKVDELPLSVRTWICGNCGS
jgi:putative transposase